jgi:uridine kinase
MNSVILDRILHNLAQRQIITIDGPAGAGKTTYAHGLARNLSARAISHEIVHMDELYNGWTDALSPALSRTLAGIVHDFHNGKVTYLVYDWTHNQFTAEKTFQSPQVLILEGVGSGQREIRSSVDISIWIDWDVELAAERAISRDGEAIRSFMEQWKVDQEAHFLLENTKNAADYLFSGAP